MATNKKPGRKYKPRKKISDPIGYFSKVPEDHRTLILTRTHTSLERLLKGDGNWKDWDEVTHSINAAVLLDIQVYDGVYADTLREAANAHASCGERGKHSQRLLYTGPELIAVRTGLEIHDHQMLQATTKETAEAVREAQRLVRAGHMNAVQKAGRA